MKKTRLLEIIHEEISAALNKNLLTEGPFIEGPLDFAYINGKVEKGILGKAVTDATQAIEKSFPNINPDSVTKIITSKKSRTSENTPESVKAALKNVDNAIQAQVETFDDTSLLKDLVNKGEIGKGKEELINVSKFINREKTYTEKLGYPQTLNAVEKILAGETPISLSPKVVAEPIKKAETEKKAVRTLGNDGFDTVNYVDKEEAKAAAAAEKANKVLGGEYAVKLSPEDELKYKSYKNDITDLVNDLENGYDKSKMEELKLYLEDNEVRRLFKAKGTKLSDLVKSVIK